MSSSGGSSSGGSSRESASIADVERVALRLPEVEESTWFRNRAWKVRSKAFVWLRPLGTKDRAELGDAAPSGTIVGVRVADADDKRAVLETYSATFTTDHFRNFDAVLVALDLVAVDDLAELITDAWLCQAPTELAEAYVAANRLG